MRSATPKLHKLARRLLALEASAGASDEATGSAAFGVCEKLRGPLTILAGASGFRFLLSRALALAGEEVRWLKALHVRSDGSLTGLDTSRLTGAEIADGEAVLVAQLLGLLVTFIGEALTLWLLQEAWPQAPLGALISEPERE